MTDVLKTPAKPGHGDLSVAPHLNRRHLLRVVGLGLGGLALAACSDDAANSGDSGASDGASDTESDSSSSDSN